MVVRIFLRHILALSTVYNKTVCSSNPRIIRFELMLLLNQKFAVPLPQYK